MGLCGRPNARKFPVPELSETSSALLLTGGRTDLVRSSDPIRCHPDHWLTVVVMVVVVPGPVVGPLAPPTPVVMLNGPVGELPPGMPAAGPVLVGPPSRAFVWPPTAPAEPAPAPTPPSWTSPVTDV